MASYVTLAQVKAALSVTDTADDAVIQLAIDAASDQIDHATNRRFDLTASAEERWFLIANGAVAIDDLHEVATPAPTIRTHTSIGVDDFYASPPNAPKLGQPYTSLSLTDTGGLKLTSTADIASDDAPSPVVAITAKWGWTAVPDQVEQAALVQSIRLVQRRHSPYGIAGSPELGSEVRLLARLDPDVEALVRPLRRVWGVA